MKSINRKVNGLEDNVFERSKVDVKTTMISYACLSKPEQRIMDLTHAIVNNFDEETPLTEAQHKILDNANYILNSRIFHLFVTALEVFCRDDKTAITQVHERLVWFIQELRKEITENLTVAEIERNADPFSEVDEVDEYFKKAPKLFTEESWYAFLDDVNQQWIAHMKKEGKWEKFLSDSKKRMEKEIEEWKKAKAEKELRT